MRRRRGWATVPFDVWVPEMSDGSQRRLKVTSKGLAFPAAFVTGERINKVKCILFILSTSYP